MNYPVAAAIFVPFFYFFNSCWRFWRNYQDARRSGLPLVLCPLDPDAMPFLLIKVPLRPLFKAILPASIYQYFQVAIFGWEFIDKSTLHDKIGRAFILVTPGENELWCADPATAHVILTRRKTFLQLPIASKIMSFLGQNILTANGESWARQRRLVAPNLNERISEVVWDETTEQANQMVKYLDAKPHGESSDTINGLRAIAINVIGQVAYGQPKPFRPLELPRDPKANMKYIDAIGLASELLVVAALAPPWLLTLPVMPLAIQTLGSGLKRIPGLLKDMLDQERQRAVSPDTRDNLMRMLVRLSDNRKTEEGNKTAGESGQYLTEDEIGGNLFIFTGAGFDSTATAMSYAIVLLAAYPEWQAWVQEEVDMVFGSQKEAKSYDYAEYFPRLQRCLAVMMETLRLFPPVIHLSRSVQTPQTLEVAGKSYYLGASTKIYINNPALHTYPSIWGEDALSFKPTRWITIDHETGAEKLVTPPRATFLPWSGGPRICPGMKMSQVEFVSVVATLFRLRRVEPIVKPGESMEQARARLLDLTEDSQIRLTLQMNKPQEIHLKWTRR